MKKFSKVLLIFALVSVVLLGVLVSCEKVEPYDFEAWQADSLDYRLAELGAKDGALEKQLGDGAVIWDIKEGVDGDGTADDLYGKLDDIFKSGGSLETAVGTEELEIVAVEGTKLTATDFVAKLKTALEARLVAAGFKKDVDGSYDDNKTLAADASVSVTATVGFMDATKDIVLKYIVVDTTE